MYSKRSIENFSRGRIECGEKTQASRKLNFPGVGEKLCQSTDLTELREKHV